MKNKPKNVELLVFLGTSEKEAGGVKEYQNKMILNINKSKTH
jgi:hypothetical protein